MKIKLITVLVLFISTTAISGNKKILSEFSQIDSTAKITAVQENENSVWIGTTKGVFKIDRKTKHLSKFNTGNSILPSDFVTSLCCRKNGEVWIGTNKGILRFDNFAFVLIKTENTDLPDDRITAIAEDANNDLWIGTYAGGLTKVHRFHYTIFTEANSALTSDSVFSLSADGKGNVWIAEKNKGILKINVFEKENDWKYFGLENSGLSASNINAVFLSDGGFFELYSHNGEVFIFDGANFTKQIHAEGKEKKVQFASLQKEEGGFLIADCEGIYFKPFVPENQSHKFCTNNLTSVIHQYTSTADKQILVAKD